MLFNNQQSLTYLIKHLSITMIQTLLYKLNPVTGILYTYFIVKQLYRHWIRHKL